MKFMLPELKYEYDDLEPVIDKKTMEIHYTKHHQGYVDKLNKALESYEGEDMSLEELMGKVNRLPGKIKTEVVNNGGGHFNHSLYWEVMTPGGAKSPQGELDKAIKERLGGYEGFMDKFSRAALTQFGSGWAWLTADEEGKLYIFQTANQNNPLMKDVVGCECVDCEGKCECGCGSVPILGIDVWEHAYYLNYQNRRPDYINAFFNVINWDEVNKKFTQK